MALQKEGKGSFYWQQMEKVLVCAEGVVAVLVQQSAGEYCVYPALRMDKRYLLGPRLGVLGSQFKCFVSQAWHLGSVYLNVRHSENCVSSTVSIWEMLICSLLCPLKNWSLQALLAFKSGKVFQGHAVCRHLLPKLKAGMFPDLTSLIFRNLSPASMLSFICLFVVLFFACLCFVWLLLLLFVCFSELVGLQLFALVLCSDFTSRLTGVSPRTFWLKALLFCWFLMSCSWVNAKIQIYKKKQYFELKVQLLVQGMSIPQESLHT